MNKLRIVNKTEETFFWFDPTVKVGEIHNIKIPDYKDGKAAYISYSISNGGEIVASPMLVTDGSQSKEAINAAIEANEEAVRLELNKTTDKEAKRVVKDEDERIAKEKMEKELADHTKWMDEHPEYKAKMALLEVLRNEAIAKPPTDADLVAEFCKNQIK